MNLRREIRARLGFLLPAGFGLRLAGDDEEVERLRGAFRFAAEVEGV
jgi:hypothetical protein